MRQSFKGDKKQLEGDSFFNREPVKFFKQDRGNVVRFRDHGNQSCFRILNLHSFFKESKADACVSNNFTG